jgi:hypothetical protein
MIEQAPAEAPQPEFTGKTLEALKKMRTISEEKHERARILSRRDTDWYDNFDNTQWSDEEKAALAARGQPIVTMNRIKKKVNFMLGFEQRGRSDPKAYPRNPSDDQAADVVTDVLDYIEQSSRFDREASLCFKDLCLSGIEVCEVIVKGGKIKADRIDVSKFFYDPRSRETDFSDARYLGYADWYDLEEAQEIAETMGFEGELSLTSDGEGNEDAEDKPGQLWEDGNRQRVLVAVVYYKTREGWAFAYHTGSEILGEGLSPYLDADKRPSCPIQAQSAYVTRENERYGPVRDMIGPQREMNFRRSMSLFLLKNKALWQRDKSVFPNPKLAKAEAAKSDGLLTANGVYGQDWGFIDSSAETMGNFELLQDAKQELDIQGPNAGLQGRGVENQSGKAIVAQQSAGVVEENGMHDAHNGFKLRVYQDMWARAKQFWTEPMYIRVTDDEQAFRFAHVNVPADPMTGQTEIDPQTGQPKPQNMLAQMDVDIIIEAGPDTITLQAAHFEELSMMVRAGLPIPPDVMIAASSIRGKKELLEKLAEAQKNPEREAAVMLELKGKEADIKSKDAETALKEAKAQSEKAGAIKDVVEAYGKAADPTTANF